MLPLHFINSLCLCTVVFGVLAICWIFWYFSHRFSAYEKTLWHLTIDKVFTKV